MALFARLISYASAAFGSGRSAQGTDAATEGDEHLAATALLVHVARADGVLDPAESERLTRLVRSRYAATESEANELISRAAAFDAETRDMSSLVELIGREGGSAERERILTMAWSVAGADGEVHEFEEALVWRLGKLLGLDEAAIGLARANARTAGDAPAADAIAP
ncbi:tellurite resistance TerB family protein [Methylobacterium thuringiense]|uniref:Co-chaperone DjlA N-terminal domain-containing protein n=1 Tax=Methylobacterium thuringiense TaxID=1003091 RepID=A0ABQ4TS40_9HYPH|nr:TerB family tellurite resistance protein [Methylobacterium thuringiense]GJE57483.1 hypothetical protein EKPJFOCH_3999 [Methylobacterium thuringiense]